MFPFSEQPSSPTPQLPVDDCSPFTRGPTLLPFAVQDTEFIIEYEIKNGITWLCFSTQSLCLVAFILLFCSFSPFIHRVRERQVSMQSETNGHRLSKTVQQLHCGDFRDSQASVAPSRRILSIASLPSNGSVGMPSFL